jgi:alkanesulfonate monooxygenase
MAADSITITANSGNLVLENGHANSVQNRSQNYVAETDINDAPDRVKFAYWVPNVSGGLVISKIPQRTK